ncbi:hypothetical protein SDC9_212377 [bioreactor metagenome]|uniref:Uncharacterized protein n=1 Tax=bioreactor metagenome TaxID=1076179 RepID=A0A645JLW3_9ZZZZ
MIIPTLRLHFNVFTYHVETCSLSQLDIVEQSLIRGSSEYAIGPVTLIEKAEMELELTIKQCTGYSSHFPKFY